MCEKNEFCVFAVRAAFAACIAVGLPLYAEETCLGEFTVLLDTNAVINVESGNIAVIDKLSGNRGTVTKTGGGLLRVCEVVNDKVKFVVNGGKLLFDRPQPSALDKAFFHVDSSRTDTLLTEELNGTNFVVRWNDVRGNGMFATNCLYTAKWRPDPENRRAFISSVTQNGMPVVDFGEMLHFANTNSFGAPRDGYGASMIWNGNGVKFREVYEVISDTPDVATIATRHPELHDRSDDIRGVSFLSYSEGEAGARRSRLHSGGYPQILQYTAPNRAWTQGRVYVDGRPTDTKGGGTIYGCVSVGAGFHLLGFTSREFNDELGYEEAAVALDSFARDYRNSFGGQRLAEYLVFTNRLDAAERASLQDYLHRKWKGVGIPVSYRVSSISVAEGASVEMTSDVTVSVAGISDRADVSFGAGSFELNPLKIPEANFHVDASLAESLSVESVNGTNFVNHWADILSNGVYATAASDATFPDDFPFLENHANRRPFVSSEILNGLSVVDFGSLMVASHTNEAGEAQGYGASMKWNKAQNTHEVFTVVRDTDDVSGLGSKGNIAQTSKLEHGMAHVCVPDYARLFRGYLTQSGYPQLFVNHGNNNAAAQGTLVIDDGDPIESETSIEQYRPSEGFHLFNYRFTTADGVTPNWFGHSRAKHSGTSYRRSFGGTKIAEYIALPVLLSNDVRQAVHSALRTKWFGIEKKMVSFRNLTVSSGAEVKVPWNDVSVSGTFSLGGEFDVSAVSAADISLSGEEASVSGALTVASGATIKVLVGVDGTLAGVEARSVTLSGGGKIVLVRENVGTQTPAVGSYPVIVAGESFSGALDGWSLDASVLGKRSCALELRNDGIYLKVAAKGLSFIVR